VVGEGWQSEGQQDEHYCVRGNIPVFVRNIQQKGAESKGVAINTTTKNQPQSRIGAHMNKPMKSTIPGRSHQPSLDVLKSDI
jgi:hypothetical protein